MSGTKKKSQKQQVTVPRTLPNEYERQRLLNIQANQRKLESLNVKRVAASMTSLVDAANDKRKKARKKTIIDEDYEPSDCDYALVEDDDNQKQKEYEQDEEIEPIITKKQVEVKGGHKRNQFIPPLALANLFKTNDKQRRELIGDDKLRSALKVVEEAICSQHRNDVTRDDIDFDEEDFTNEEFDRLMGYQIKGNRHPIYNTDEEYDQMDEESGENPQEEQGGEGSSQDDVSGKGVEDQGNGDKQIVHADKSGENPQEEHGGEGSSQNDVSGKGVEDQGHGDKQIVDADSDLHTLGKAKKVRGQVYCRKLTALAPGKKLFVKFDTDGNPIDGNASIFAFFLGEQVRNRSVCPVQVENWEDFTLETLDHLWRCILEKFEFDNPELRREGIMKHARSLFRGSRHKLRRKYILNPNLTTKEAQLKNKPNDMLKSDWKYLVELWRSPKFQEKSRKAKESRSFQKMPHYTGTKSHARVKEDIKKKNGGECSRVDLLLETRKRNSKKPVNSTTLAYNMHAVDEVNKLTNDREQGLNDKTDDEILTDVLGIEAKGYLRCYGRGKTITQYYGLKPSRLELITHVMEAKKAAEGMVQEAKKEVEDAKKEIERMRKVSEDATKEKEALIAVMDARFEETNKAWEKKMVAMLETYGISPSH